MNLLHKLTGLSLVLALCAALMAGCGSTADKAADAPSQEAAQTETAQETTAPETEEAQDGEPADETGEPAEGEPGFDSAALAEALGGICNVGPGSAGSDLRAVRAAGDLVLFAAGNVTPESIPDVTEGIDAWFAGQDEEALEEFALAWPMVSDYAGQIEEAPDLLASQLADAGLEEDFSELDRSTTSYLLEIIDVCTDSYAQQ